MRREAKEHIHRADGLWGDLFTQMINEEVTKVDELNARIIVHGITVSEL